MTCETCPHFDLLQSLCRRSSPRAFAMSTENPAAGIQIIAAFPPVRKSDWCSKHPDRRNTQVVMSKDTMSLTGKISGSAS